MSSRQFTQFGGSGEIVTLDDINEYDDLPPLAEIDSPDVYEIRTGELGTDYLVPMQDGSTDFNEWYSLVDGQIIRAISDIVVDDFESGDLTHWSGETDKYVVDDSDPVKEGTYSCKNIGDDDGNVYIGSAEGKDDVPQVGIAHRIWIHPGTSGNSITTVYFGNDTIDDRGTGYGVRLSSNDNEVRLERYDDGSITVLGTDSSIGTIDDSWFEVIVLHEENGDFTVWVFDESGEERTTDGLTENDSAYITDGTYDNSIVTLEDGRGEGDAFDDWRYTKAPE